ncbi:saccharopine dehydrogenase NADP-binding domain-containing protein [Bacteroides xylanisolvens]|uniref:saccharopine dehydrogenase NADP-binding domain-containing protein n=1 Tax=Bacteroides xylanisolvens TaxID=371601 RepID=UPI0023070E54|nr:saccharopine dehydrogenase NADP-binding domain-containing protein [Bacteroides xylanisolvens]MDB0717097.1 saccharopine dehydrogenase NADP-binding domain-containing protein [Bacteroides xylanisolvens]
MVYNKYIGIIGGTGTIGSIIVKYLLQLQTHFHVLIGGRRSIKEISMSTFYNSERLKYNQMNYNNDVELDNFCSQCLLVINAVGPSFKIGIVI